MKKIGLNTILNFGTHKGKTVKKIIQEGEYSYITWCINNIDNFNITKGVENLINIAEAEDSSFDDFPFPGDWFL